MGVAARRSSTWRHAANVPLLIVNEPTYIGSGPNSDVNYNSFYERNVYDRFRAALADFMQQHAMTYLDLWNFLPAEDFSNTSLHYNLDGNRLVAEKALTLIKRYDHCALCVETLRIVPCPNPIKVSKSV